MSLCIRTDGGPAFASHLLLVSGVVWTASLPAKASAHTASEQSASAPVDAQQWANPADEAAPPLDSHAADSGAEQSQPPADEDDAQFGFETGFRTGLGLAVGSAGVDDSGATRDLSSMASLRVPLWIDVMYRTAPDWSGGVYGQYGMGTAGSACPGSCNWAELRAGVQGQWDLASKGNSSPWLGLGLGYQWLTFRTINAIDLGLSDGPDDELPLQRTESLHGPELLLQGGIDFAVHRGFSVGPYASATFSHFVGASRTCDNPDAAEALPTQVACPASSVDGAGLHAWLGVGLRGSFKP